MQSVPRGGVSTHSTAGARPLSSTPLAPLPDFEPDVLATLVKTASDHELHQPESQARLAMEVLINLAANDTGGREARDALRSVLQDAASSPLARSLLSNCAHEMCRTRLAEGSKELSAALALIAAHAPEPPHGANGPAQQHALEQHAARKLEHAIPDQGKLLGTDRPVTRTELLATAKSFTHLQVAPEPIPIGDANMRLYELGQDTLSAGAPKAAWVQGTGPEAQWLLVVAEPAGGAVQWHVVHTPPPSGCGDLAEELRPFLAADTNFQKIDDGGVPGSGATLLHLAMKHLDAGKQDGDKFAGVRAELLRFNTDWNEKDVGSRQSAVTAARSELLDNVEPLTAHEAGKLREPAAASQAAGDTQAPGTAVVGMSAASAKDQSPAMAQALQKAGFATDSNGKPVCLVKMAALAANDQMAASGVVKHGKQSAEDAMALRAAVTDYVAALPPDLRSFTTAALDLRQAGLDHLSPEVLRAHAGGRSTGDIGVFRQGAFDAQLGQIPTRLNALMEDAFTNAERYRQALREGETQKAEKAATIFAQKMAELGDYVRRTVNGNLSEAIGHLTALAGDKTQAASTCAHAAALRDAMVRFQAQWVGEGSYVHSLVTAADLAKADPRVAIESLFKMAKNEAPLQARPAHKIYFRQSAELAGFFRSGKPGSPTIAVLNATSAVVDVVSDRRRARSESLLRRSATNEIARAKLDVTPNKGARDFAEALSAVDRAQQDLSLSPIWETPPMSVSAIFTVDELQDRLSAPVGRMRDASRKVAGARDASAKAAAEAELAAAMREVNEFILQFRSRVAKATGDLTEISGNKSAGAKEVKDAQTLLTALKRLNDSIGFLTGLSEFTEEATRDNGRYLAMAAGALLEVTNLHPV